jgi:hypothetical protein
MSAVSPLPVGLDENAEDVSPVSEPSRPTQPWVHPPPTRDALGPLDEQNFDFHDTIPAPPWFGEASAPDAPRADPALCEPESDVSVPAEWR